ncbi:MAG: hypothetical protein JWO38_7807 [Gemmataceae bacterium]|nr:hypothetical protein [Gemmataceae bacterium]
MLYLIHRRNLMKLLFRYQLMAVASILSSTAAAAAPADEIEAQVAKAKDAYAVAMKKTDEKLVAAFDRVGKALPTVKMTAEERLKMIEVAEAEKVAFEKSGRIPWSGQMRPAVVEYLKSVKAARAAVERDFDRAIEFHTKSKNVDRAKEYLTGKQELLKPRVLAVCDYTYAPDKTIQIRFMSDGTVNGQPEQTWSLDTTTLIYRRRDENAKGGQWVDTLKISEDGKTIHGRNQQINQPKSGKFVEP